MEREMKLILAVIFLFFVNSCNSESTRFREFNNFLGKKKAANLDRLIESFDTFLIDNYPDEVNNQKRIERLFLQLRNEQGLKSKFKFRVNDIKTILVEMEDIGLRKDIWIFENEKYYPLFNSIGLLWRRNLDTALYFDSNSVVDVELEIEEIPQQMMKTPKKKRRYLNFYGKVVYGILKYQNDEIVRQWAEVLLNLPSHNYTNVTEGFLNIKFDITNPFYKRILVLSVFFDIIYANNEFKGLIPSTR
jgi:hypothetical protein